MLIQEINLIMSNFEENFSEKNNYLELLLKAF